MDLDVVNMLDMSRVGIHTTKVKLMTLSTLINHPGTGPENSLHTV